MKSVSYGSRSFLVLRCAPHVRRSRGRWCAATLIAVSWIIYHMHVVLRSVTNKLASCGRRVPLWRRCSVVASYWYLRISSTAQSAWSVSWKEIVELSLPCGWSCVEMFRGQGLTADWLCAMCVGCMTHSAATHSQTDSLLLWERNTINIGICFSRLCTYQHSVNLRYNFSDATGSIKYCLVFFCKLWSDLSLHYNLA